MEKIELIRGGALGIDMRGKPVLANVVRKSARGLRGAVSAESYWTEQGDVLPGVTTEVQRSLGDVGMEFSLQAGRKPDDQVTPGSRTRIAADGTLLAQSDRDGVGETERVWTTGALEAPLGGGRTKLNVAYKHSPYQSQVREVESRSGILETETVEEDPRQIEMGVWYLRTLGSNAEFEATAFRQWSDVHTDALNVVGGETREFLLESTTDETVLRNQVSWDRSSRMRIEVGTEAAINTLLSETAFLENGIAMPVPAANVRVRERRTEVFTAATLWPASTLTLDIGLRQEWSAISARGDAEVDKRLVFTKPRVAATWDFASSHQLRARIAREVDQLSFDDFVASSALVNTGVVLAGNPDLDPQRAWVAEVALETRFWSEGAVILELRHSKLADVIDRVPVRDATGEVIADAPGNIGEGRLDELAVSLSIPLDRFGFTGADFHCDATFSDSRVTDPTTGRVREISDSSPQEVEFRLRQDVPGTRLTWGVRGYAAMTERSYRHAQIETRREGVWIAPFMEYVPARGWLIRAELQSATRGDLDRIRHVYAGSRATESLAYVDRRAATSTRALYVSLKRHSRKSSVTPD